MVLFKELFIVLCASIAIWASGEFQLSSYIRNVSGTVCPYTNYCSTERVNTVSDETFMPCCSDCSCDASTCYQTENCCPDLEPTPNISSDLICVDTMTKDDETAKKNDNDGYSFGIKRYFIVTSCPNDFNDDYIHSMCRGDNKTELDDFLWVSHAVKDTIYQNYYCAMCQGVENWVPWNVRTNCFIEFMKDHFQNVSTTILSDRCYIVNEVPESKVDVSRKYQCYIPTEADTWSCNETGKTINFYLYYTYTTIELYARLKRQCLE